MIPRASLALLLLACGFAQQTAPLTFEVASIKPANPDVPGTSIHFIPGGGLNITNMPLRGLVTFAYDVREFQVSGGPRWAETERFDIAARPERASADRVEDPSKMTDAQLKTVQEQTRERLRALLVDRFQLVVHNEIKEQPIYAVVVAKNGSKLHEAKELGSRQGMSTGRGRAQGFAAPMEMLAQSLSNQLGWPVVDKTGLTAKYDFVLEWTPDMGAAGDVAPVGPTIFTALQEQLGLRLESQKGPVPNIVIDRVEKPSEN